jgi:hypothetical protein
LMEECSRGKLRQISGKASLGILKQFSCDNCEIPLYICFPMIFQCIANSRAFFRSLEE